MKKLLALFVAVIMVTSMVMPAMCVLAEETQAVDYSDYEAPTERTDNLLQDGGNLSLYQQTNSDAVTVTAATEDKSESKYTYVGLNGEKKWANSGYYSVEGNWSGSYRSGSLNTMCFNGYLPTGPEDYVVEMKLKNSTPTVDAAPVFAVTLFADRVNEAWNNRKTVTVTETENWQTFRTTISTTYVTSNFIFGLGYPTTTDYPELGTGVVLKNDSMYIAIEKVHDIEVTGTTLVSPGGTAELKAQVVNQIGLPGNLTQDFTWTALNADRSATVEGFDFVKGTNGAVTVNVADTVATGKYVILAAHSDEDSIENGIQKGIELVVSEYQDYVAPTERTDNLIKNNMDLNFYQDKNTQAVSIVQGETSSEVNYTYIGDGNGNGKWDNTQGYYGIEGTWAKSTEGDAGASSGFNGWYPAGPESFVVEMQIRNAAPDKNANPEFALSLLTDRAEGVEERQIIPVTATNEWQTVKTVFHTDKETPSSMWIALGYCHIPSTVYPAIGTTVALYKPSLYVAIEKVHDIEVTGTTLVSPGGTAELKAQVVNQVGLPGNLTQDFTWTALNADRSAAVDGFSFTEGTDGAVTVKVADSVVAGKYTILAAHSDEDSIENGIRKGIEIEVVAGTEVTEASVTKENGKAYFNSAKVENAVDGKEVMFVVASYDVATKKMTAAKGTKATVADGIAQLAEAIEIKANEGDNVRIFVWYADTFTPISFADDVVNEF